WATSGPATGAAALPWFGTDGGPTSHATTTATSARKIGPERSFIGHRRVLLPSTIARPREFQIAHAAPGWHSRHAPTCGLANLAGRGRPPRHHPHWPNRSARLCCGPSPLWGSAAATQP